MPTINRVLIGFASLVCTAVTFSAALSPAIPAARQVQASVMRKDAAQDRRYQVMAGLWQRRAAGGAETCVSQGRQRPARCGGSDAGAGQGRVFTLLD